jgi:hypothetical protein
MTWRTTERAQTKMGGYICFQWDVWRGIDKSSAGDSGMAFFMEGNTGPSSGQTRVQRFL